MSNFSTHNSNNKDQAISARKAFICSLLYVIAVDGEVDSQEIGNLLAITGGEKREGTIVVGGDDPGLFKDSFEFVKTHPYEDFLGHIQKTGVLNTEQKLFILIHMLNSSLTDGKLEPGEQKIIVDFQQSFGISDADFKPYSDVILFKNNKTIIR